jgi:hypothetical protein
LLQDLAIENALAANLQAGFSHLVFAEFGNKPVFAQHCLRASNRCYQPRCDGKPIQHMSASHPLSYLK